MCGAFGFNVGVKVYRERFNVSNDLKIKPSINVRPSMQAVVVTKNSPNFASYKRFGLEAPWKKGQYLINAKAETINELRSFKTLFRESRCLVLADHYYEWKVNEDGTKTPYLFKLSTGQCFAFAGICDSESFAIVTCPPNSVQRPIHSRMPVILKRDDEETWLNLDSEEDHLLELLQPYNAGIMETYPVSTLVNSPKNQGEELIKPIEEK